MAPRLSGGNIISRTPALPRILHIDIETQPNLAYVWGLHQQDVGLSQLAEPVSTMCFAAKWHHVPGVEFFSEFENGHKKMVKAAYDLLDQADIVVHYNGKAFDVPHLNREFLLAGYTPPSPYKQVDLLQQVRSNFHFPSSKLAYVSEALDMGGKVKHEGFELWKRCMAGDEMAWAKMRRYNIQDVRLLEKMFDRLQGWLKLPAFGLYSDNVDACNSCGSTNLQRRGFAYTPSSKFQQYVCNDCGRYCRSKKAVQTVNFREVS